MGGGDGYITNGGDIMNSATQRYYKVSINYAFQEQSTHHQHVTQGSINAGHMAVALEKSAPENELKRRVIEKALVSMFTIRDL
jgi:hypothetical protein